MAFSAFETITAAKLNRQPPTTYQVDGTTLTLTTTATDLPSASITLNTVAANAVWVATGDFDAWAETVVGTVVISGQLSVDGVTDAREAVLTGMTTGTRANISRTWRGTVAAAGSHTFKLRGRRDTGATGSYKIPGSTLTVAIYEVV